MQFCQKLSSSFAIAFLVLTLGVIFLLPTVEADNQMESNGPYERALITKQGALSLKGGHGKVTLLFFGYTACPTVCPISLVTMANALTEMTQDELTHVRALFVTLDPERDSLDVLNRYTDYFHPHILGATGSTKTIARVANEYGIRFKKSELADSALGYVIDHTADIVLLDSQGNLQTTFPHNQSSKQIIISIRKLINSDVD